MILTGYCSTNFHFKNSNSWWSPAFLDSG